MGGSIGMQHLHEEIKKESRTLLAIGSPIIATQLLRMGLNFTDTVMAGNLSALDLAAVAIGNSIYVPIGIFCMATLIAINPVVSQFLGARKFDEIGKSARQMFWLVLMLAIPTFFLIRNLDIVMRLVGVTPEIIPIADGYLKAISWGMLPLLAYAGVRYFSEGLSVTKPAMYIAAASLVLNVGANYVLMYGKLGFPALGAVGTGYATTFINFFGAVVFIGFTASFEPFKRFNIFARTKGPEWEYIGELIRVGIPNGISSAMEVLLFAAVSLLMGTLSVKAAAAHQIAINVAATMFMVPFGLSIGISQRVGFSIGQGSMENARFRGYVGIVMCAGVMTLTAILLFLVPDFIISIYTDDPEVATTAVSLIFMAAIFQISDGLQVGAFGALRGLKDTRLPMIVNFISYWLVGFTTGYGLGIHLGYGPEGLWIGLICGLTVAAVLHNIRFHRLTK
ncbi:multidrug resistance protein, MATE family [Gracilimonas mengyeensis]|uniref:Multidrug-efflux transporter n=1 Tax=Gracilimonas mengyeensis TaxID=1302730 RepID=A0A521FIS0_9BACT|nr:multidrug resistance protein, MATE family [Gracilimonas mengyeensis]